jgi:hypothetical protein
MALMIVRHKIKDYSTWKAVFDESEDLRKDYGFKGGYICRGETDPNDLFVVLECESLSRAREFMALPKLREWMNKSGVIGEPDIYYLTENDRVHELTTARQQAVAGEEWGD